MTARYARVLDERVLHSLLPGRPYHFLVTEFSANDPYAVDVQLRERNTVMYYHGTTRILTIRFIDDGQLVAAKADADKAYFRYPGCRQQYQELMKPRPWTTQDADPFRRAFLAYLPSAIAASGARYYRNEKEGYWQNRLCIRYGREWVATDDWLIVDRECVVGFGNRSEKRRFYEEARKLYQGIRNQVQSADAAAWGRPSGKAFGDELDMLAIDRSGALVVVELKHGSNSSGIYWGPLQVALYHGAFSEVIRSIRSEILDLARQKIALGLLPQAARSVLDTSSLASVEAVLAVANPNERSRCWQRLDRVVKAMHVAGVPHKSLPLTIARIHVQDNDLAIETTPASQSDDIA